VQISGVGAPLECNLHSCNLHFVFVLHQVPRRARVRAAFRAAAERPAVPFVLTALRAAAERSAADRFRAEARAWRESARFVVARRGSRRNALRVARARRADGRFAFFRPLANARFADFRVSAGASPFFGAGNLTPARRALDRPIAIACLADRAPCFPSRT
jgi:hypothetical protein